MALIICPECGKENVSDSAPTCPKCGFAIREHFENIEKIRIANDQEIQKRKQTEEKRLKDIENVKQQERRRMASITIPEKPRFPKAAFITGNIFLIMGGYLLYDSSFFTLLLIIIGLVILRYGYSLYSKKQSEYKLALSNFEEYQKQKIKEQDEAEAQLKQNAKNRMEAANNVPKCPYCHSINIKFISMINRLISVGMVGIASSKIGKTMECRNCGYKW